MSVTISQYCAELEPAVKAFNQRLARGGVSYRFPESQESTLVEDAPIVRRGFVALQDGESVRGGYLLKEQQFWLNGRGVQVAYLHLPLSEGLIDRTYSTLGVQLFAHALKHRPLLFGLGIGGQEEPFARLVLALGWKLESVPFFFKLVHPFRVARGLSYARRTWTSRMLCDTAAWTGTAWLSTRTLRYQEFLRQTARDRVEQVSSLDAIANEIWNRHRWEYRLVAWRDRAALQVAYPAGQRAYIRFQVFHRNIPIGWAVTLDTRMSGHKYFGNLRVGTIVDCLGAPQHAGRVIAAVSRELAARGVDLVVTNQSARLWQAALRVNGFLRGPSNFLLAVCPQLANELSPLPASLARLHLTRGDGDGPINL